MVLGFSQLGPFVTGAACRLRDIIWEELESQQSIEWVSVAKFWLLPERLLKSPGGMWNDATNAWAEWIIQCCKILCILEKMVIWGSQDRGRPNGTELREEEEDKFSVFGWDSSTPGSVGCVEEFRLVQLHYLLQIVATRWIKFKHGEQCSFRLATN